MEDLFWSLGFGAVTGLCGWLLTHRWLNSEEGIEE